MTGVFLYDFLREWPGAVGMRIVRTPHGVAVAEELEQMETDKVGLKSRPDLALENFAGHRLERDFLGFSALELPFVAIIHFLHDTANPADGGFGEAEIELGMALQSPEVEHVDEGIEKRRGAVAETHVEHALALARLDRVD